MIECRWNAIWRTGEFREQTEKSILSITDSIPPASRFQHWTAVVIFHCSDQLSCWDEVSSYYWLVSWLNVFLHYTFPRMGRLWPKKHDANMAALPDWVRVLSKRPFAPSSTLVVSVGGEQGMTGIFAPISWHLHHSYENPENLSYRQSESCAQPSPQMRPLSTKWYR